MVVIECILVFRVADCTSVFELDEDNPSDWLFFDERLETVQNVDDEGWELLTVELFDKEFELELITMVDNVGGVEEQFPSGEDWDTSS